MSASLRPRQRIMSIEDFLSWESRQEERWEFDGFEPVAMVGGTRNHARIQANLALALGLRLRGGPCEFLGSDMKVVTGTQSRYPDGQVVCGVQAGSATFVTASTILFEVVSASTRDIDHGAKLDEYRNIASVVHYVIVDQERCGATVHTRDPDRRWTVLVAGTGGEIALPAIGVVLPVAEIYEGIAFPNS